MGGPRPARVRAARQPFLVEIVGGTALARVLPAMHLSVCSAPAHRRSRPATATVGRVDPLPDRANCGGSTRSGSVIQIG
jgi:hypothetical protein